MSDLFSKVSEILSDPESAQKIREIASSLSRPSESAEGDLPPLPTENEGEDDRVGQILSGLSSSGTAHSRELALLSAVRPYMRTSRIETIDRAMRAIRVIDMLSNFR